MLGQPIRTYLPFFEPVAPAPDPTCWREDGTSFSIEYETAPVIEAGRAVGTIVTFRDVTLRRASEQLKDEVISAVSHELRTPLTSIRSTLGLLAGGVVGNLPEKGRRLLDIAVNNTDRLIRLVNDTLDLERIESGQSDFTPVPCDAGELAVQAADGVRSLAELAGVHLEVLPMDARVWGDPDRLIQVLTNLLSNAIKFSPAEGGTVWLDAEESASELVFRVRDEGRGIPPEKLDVIFERFAQVDKSDARDKGGTGLGLAISRAIVNQHGGQIWAESTPGAGTTLCVALPCDAAEAEWLLSTPEADGDEEAAAA
jgi:signal transduction histidine kinase